MLLIGSRALILVAPFLINRKPKDFDFICTKEEFESWLDANTANVSPTKVYEVPGNKMIVEGSVNCEFELITPGSSNELLRDIVDADPDTLDTPFGKVPNLDLLFTIKASHKYLKNSPHFWKTVLDYHRMKAYGAKIRPEYQAFFKLREKETYTYAHPKLNVTKKDFFADDGLVYSYDHDSIHEAVAIYDRPAYTHYMKDGSEVQCDKNKFFALPESLRQAGVMEEAAVLAVERSLVPHPGVWTPDYAWKFALSKVCTSITSGWFREYAYENILGILANYPNYPFWDKFQNALAENRVKPFTGKNY